ncbi:MAG TPA: tyrosine--tRNA ligase [Planctomycetota bacterium]|nr:tyrosine--tRNA ligase [Planctomycetota bacterium]
MPTNIVEELRWRGLVHQLTDEALEKKLLAESYTLYCGFDPTADSLAAHHLIALLNLARFQRAGHAPIAVVGGGTGFIGDPSGKSEERSLLTAEQLDRNVAGMKAQMERFLDFSPGTTQARLLNNADWLCNMNLISYLRDVGKHFTVNVMMEKESVRKRLEDRSQGISYTEFSYMLLQAYDFYYLFQHHACRLQIGGSDQFGNITAGIELIRRKRPEAEAPEKFQAYGLTTPLITDANGEKIGKTTKGALWLDPNRTSPFDFYQYWINVTDADALKYLRFFTELDRDTVGAIETEHAADPSKRPAQRKLAALMTEKVHGLTERQKAEDAAAALFGKGKPLSEMDEKTLLELVKEAPSSTLPKSRLEGDGLPIVDLLAEAPKLWPSKGEAKRSIQGGAANLNNNKVTDLQKKVTTADLLHGKYLVLRKGKKDYHLIRAE